LGGEYVQQGIGSGRWLEAGECAFGHVEEIAGGCQVKDIILLTVLETPGFPFTEYWSQAQIDMMIKQQELAEQELKQKAEQYLAGAVDYLKTRGVTAQSVLVKPDPLKSTADVILEYAENNNVDLILISTHGRSGFPDGLSGA